jgi:hypothetical protein
MRIVKQIKLWRRTKWFFGNSLKKMQSLFLTSVQKEVLNTYNTFVQN